MAADAGELAQAGVRVGTAVWVLGQPTPDCLSGERPPSIVPQAGGPRSIVWRGD